MPSGIAASPCREKFSCYQICSELAVRCPVHYPHLPTFPFRVTWLETVRFPMIPCTRAPGSLVREARFRKIISANRQILFDSHLP